MIIDWSKVRRVLVVRLRSIGDTVLATPSLAALRRFLPDAQIDILLEDWVAPLLDGFNTVDNVIPVPTKNSVPVNKDKIRAKDLLFIRLLMALSLRETKYDVAFNLHGGTTATFFVRASGAKHRVGYKNYQYNFLYNHLLASPSDFWRREQTHSAEQQLALLGFVGVPVSDKPKSRLVVTEEALKSLKEKVDSKTQGREDAKIFSDQSAFRIPHFALALLHPAAAFEAKQWATENYARVTEFLHEKGFYSVAVATPKEREVLENLKQNSRVPILIFDDLTLPEITALAARAEIFVGNDSGIAHIAAAVETPTVVIFGSSNIHHWRPWTNAPNEIVFFDKQSQSGASENGARFDKEQSIRRISVESVCQAVEKVLLKAET